MAPEISKKCTCVGIMNMCARVCVCVCQVLLAEVEANSQFVYPPLTFDFSFCHAESNMCVLNDFPGCELAVLQQGGKTGQSIKGDICSIFNIDMSLSG